MWWIVFNFSLLLAAAEEALVLRTFCWQLGGMGISEEAGAW